MSTTWKTKYGPRRVRNDPPTLEEAIFAARGLTEDVQEQVEIAATRDLSTGGCDIGVGIHNSNAVSQFTCIVRAELDRKK